MNRRRIAVVGSGVAGLTAAYVLQRETDVTLYEADDRLGGHADTHEVLGADGVLRHIDTGFIVHNLRTYPLLRRLFRDLNVATQESDMSMSISCGGCGLEYAGGRGLSGLLPSVRTTARPAYLRMLREVTRFHRQAQALLARDDAEADAVTVREFLAAGRFSDYFAAHFMTPMIAAVWSTAPTRAGDYPARYLFSFLDNHGMLSVKGSPTWYTVTGGSARYVERAAKSLTAVETSTPVRSVRRLAQGVEIRTDADTVETFDGAVIATHPDQALSVLDAATGTERELLGAIGYTVNPTLLHTDTAVLPRLPRAQASWNYSMPSCTAPATTVQVSYNMNRLQRLDSGQTYVVSLNAEDRVDPSTVVARMDYAHPVYDTASVAAITRLPELNDGTLAFAGAYHGWGFHEDGCRAGVAAAASLGVSW
ncbi:NAD(P)/FAD-dependent oxidoreductase [Jatrophihabitans endophyticus]|uniref:NAD(P)/FAD-dependent oxidoreductase n=1 Tax=Jatrophihabitans endophyticus TaxID=1206085 RepID=UPI0019ECEFC2|nr:FAD-dependent oxidoreductase [Jatrophihabitans endophyticus]MBE7186672.1 FAD-dependent oxidoreductase [Jatrophihabitans endophyticus]